MSQSRDRLQQDWEETEYMDVEVKSADFPAMEVVLRKGLVASHAPSTLLGLVRVKT
jgi:hypothetical protein